MSKETDAFEVMNPLVYLTNTNTYCDREDPEPRGRPEIGSYCSDGVDNDCDGFTDSEVLGCRGSSAAANAQASLYGSNSVTGSGLVNQLSLLLIPLGAVTVLRILRSRRGRIERKNAIE